MSIQSTINQGLSLVSFLVSQIPSVKIREDAAAAERARETAAATAEGRLEEEQKFKEQAEEDRRTGIRLNYATHSKLVARWTGGKSSERTLEEARLTRENALKYGRQLYEFEPTEELATAIGGYERDLADIKRVQEDRRQKTRIEEQNAKIARRRQSKIQKQKEAEEAAAEAAAIEQRRQAITQEITRPFDPTVDKFKW